MSWGVGGTEVVAALWQSVGASPHEAQDRGCGSCSIAEATLFRCVTRQLALHLASVPARWLQALV